MKEEEVDILVIGAGPAGLAMAGRFKRVGIKYRIIESTECIAPAWHRYYDRLHLHTVKQWSHLPHLPFPANYPLYVPRQELLEYFEAYRVEFGIEPVFNQTVTSIRKEGKKWRIESQDSIYNVNKVIVATGVNRTPNIPKWDGQEKFNGDIVHSRNYKNATPFLNKKVLVVGMGNTGAELALDLTENGVDTYISVRGTISVVPRDVFGRPVQVSSKQLTKLPWGLDQWIGRKIRKFYFGDISEYGLRESPLDPVQQLLETGKTPIVDIGTISAIKEGRIRVHPNLISFKGNGVIFDDGSSLQVDAVILATGYHAKLESFFPNVQAFLDAKGLPKKPIGTEAYKGAYFLGFDNYKLGGILGTIFNDSEMILQDIISTA